MPKNTWKGVGGGLVEHAWLWTKQILIFYQNLPLGCMVPCPIKSHSAQNDSVLHCMAWYCSVLSCIALHSLIWPLRTVWSLIVMVLYSSVRSCKVLCGTVWFCLALVLARIFLHCTAQPHIAPQDPVCFFAFVQLLQLFFLQILSCFDRIKTKKCKIAKLSFSQLHLQVGS